MSKIIILLITLILISCTTTVAKYGLDADSYSKIKNESVNGGIIDFRTALADDPNEVYIMKDIGKWFNKNDMAAFKWTVAVKKLGVADQKSVVALYKEIYGDNLSDRTMQAIYYAWVAK